MRNQKQSDHKPLNPEGSPLRFKVVVMFGETTEFEITSIAEGKIYTIEEAYEERDFMNEITMKSGHDHKTQRYAVRNI